MNDFQLTKHNLNELFEQLQNELNEKPVLIVSIKSAGTGKWGMSRLWRAWMKTTADFMASNGVTMPLMFDKNCKPYGKRPFNAQDAYELFIRQHMGVDEQGKRLSWAKQSGNGARVATKGERFHAMLKHQIWCTERGINLFNPRDGEFAAIEMEQNK